MNPGPSVGIAVSAPWMSHGATYPSSYIVTGVPPPRASSNVYKPSVECPQTQSWRIPDPYDCSVYHDCNSGADLISYCPAQLLYNPERQICDYAYNVQCNEQKNSFLYIYIQLIYFK